MKRLFISLLLLLTPLALIRGGDGTEQKLDGRSSHEAESHKAELKKLNDHLKAQKLEELKEELFEKEFLENNYKYHKAMLDHAIVLDDLWGCDNVGCRNVDCHCRRNKRLEKIAPEVIKDIDCDPNNEAIILDKLCSMDPEETRNDSDEVKNEKVSTCKAFFIKFFSEYRERIKKTKEDDQEK